MNRHYRDYCHRHGAELLHRKPPDIGPTLSGEELAEVYRAAMSTDLNILRDTAVRMFPERFQEQPPELYSHAGGGRVFRHHGEVIRPERTIGAKPMHQIGIMADGMAYPY